jgi:Asp-tRNA(Asn)/Glu-tRNA(Gln) amidotransferase A subunit family amidase/quercetin dioxygenase-like cupin family protein
MSFREYASYDGLGLAELVAKGEVTASELVEEAIARIEKHNPTLNAVIHKTYEMARKVAGDPPAAGQQGIFQGVPFLLKDILGDCKGVPTTSACRFFTGLIAPVDSELVIRYKRAGFIPLGKTNAPELGILPTTEPLLYGPSRNPWNTLHSTGGSSGGSAAAVAAGILPIAHANDGGGSIRIPATCCGLVGLKPTRGRNPLGPMFGDLMNGLVCEHVVTRTVRDSAAVLDCTAGPDVGDPYWAPPPDRPYLEEVSRDPGSLRLACWSKTFRDEPIHPDCAAAVKKTADICADLGHQVEEAAPTVDLDKIDEAITVLFAASCGPLRTGEGRERRPVSDLRGRAAARIPPDRRLLRGLRRLDLADARYTSGEARHHRSLRGRSRQGAGTGSLLCSLHVRVQRDRAAGDLASASPERRRPPRRRATGGAVRRRGAPLPPLRSARAGAPLDRPKAPDLGLTPPATTTKDESQVCLNGGFDMKVISLDQITRDKVDMEGAKDVCKQVPLGQNDGSPTYSFRVFTVDPSGHTPYHQHPYEHLNYVIEGHGTLIEENGAEREIKKGDFALVLPNETHQYRNESKDEPLVMICAVPKEFE